MTSRATNSTWESITSANSLMLGVSSSTMALGGFYTAVEGPGKGIWLGFLKGESSGTPRACRTANQPSLKASFRASCMTGSADFFASANPSLYHLFCRPPKLPSS